MDVKKENEIANLKILHGSPDLEPVDIMIDNQMVANQMLFQQCSDYLPLNKGKYQVKINNSMNQQCLLDDMIEMDCSKFMILSPCKENKVNLVLVDDAVTPIDMITQTPTAYYLPSDMRATGIIKKVMDQFNHVVEVSINQLGIVVDDVKDSMGNIIIASGSQLIKVMDHLNNTAEVIIDQTGTIIAKVMTTSGDVIGITVGKVGNIIKRVTDTFGNLVGIVINDLEEVVGWVIGGIGTQVNQADEASSVTKLVELDSDRLSQEPIQCLSKQTPIIEITLPNGCRMIIQTF